ncbi:hypothetical protein BDN70DRAFT_689855 [Pholiota conissans]|uniref:Uncharacterized protein n=1 Tax=Pholiota conissans TaxID=109636 RepID=A0A9P6CUD0_9AGAR|nr:hypothetical protein BDN70DRAFT_689855 [Pholiota conissans]
MFNTSTKLPTSVTLTNAISACTKNKQNVRSGDQRADAQISLVTALRKVIIPLIQATIPDHDLNYLNDVEIGDEADDLLAALQKYISTVVRNGTKTRVVDLTETSMKVDSKPELVGPSRVQVLSDEPERNSSTLQPNTVKNTAGRNVEKSISPAEEMVIFWGRNKNVYPFAFSVFANRTRTTPNWRSPCSNEEKYIHISSRDSSKS